MLDLLKRHSSSILPKTMSFSVAAVLIVTGSKSKASQFLESGLSCPAMWLGAAEGLDDADDLVDQAADQIIALARKGVLPISVHWFHPWRHERPQQRGA